MFDLTNAVILGLVLVGLIAIARTLLFGTNRERVIVVACVIVSFITVMLVAASDFAHEQVVLNRPLDSMNFGSQLVIVVLLVGLASALWQGYKALSHVGGESHL